ncbi:hypothetical protein [Ornithinimicrobium pratense]|uniref:Uncharacterized protein n=1 Tax=Ornithinimicrobium pratense TaxID=2593973 RepID=A0A5J6V982_9MICO|nr:hypothetical protein [Ornithinimicrobium pratense]QFG69683.1 hypothetical protein FY030_14110 [Ornithinimicrobium pratense]
MTTEVGGAGERGRLTWGDLGRPGEKMAMGVPPFRYTVQVPPGWKVLRPTEELKGDVERMCTATPGWSNLAADKQVALRDLLTGMATQAGLTGAVLTAADAGVDRATGELLMGSLSLAWLRTSPIEADTALAQMMAEGGGDVRQFAGRYSVCVLQRSVADTGIEPVEGAGRTAYTVQAFVPTPGTSWMGIVTGTTPQQRMAELMERATERMATTLHLLPAETVAG